MSLLTWNIAKNTYLWSKSIFWQIYNWMVREKSLTTELAFVVSKLSDGNLWASLKCSFPCLFFSLITHSWMICKTLQTVKMHHIELQGPNKKPLKWFHLTDLRCKYSSQYSMLIGMFRYCQILLIPDILSNGLNFVSLHGPLVSLRGLNKMIAWSQVCSPQELNLLTQARQCSTFAEWIFTSHRILCPQITLFPNFPLR